MLKYNEKFPAIAEDLAANGESDEYIAFRLQISMPTFYNYKAQFPEFAEALVVGRKVCYSRVRAKLLKLAQGRCTVITEVYKDGELYKTTERQLPPNLKAISYFQKHMRIGKITINENTLPQEDSKMSNGEEKRTERTGQTRPTCPTSPAAPAVLENTLPQTDSKMSNGEEIPTEQTERTNPTDQQAVRLVPQSGDPACQTSPTDLPAPESALPQTDSKMSNGQLSGEF
jgi:hypothetical protein